MHLWKAWDTLCHDPNTAKVFMTMRCVTNHTVMIQIQSRFSWQWDVWPHVHDQTNDSFIKLWRTPHYVMIQQWWMFHKTLMSTILCHDLTVMNAFVRKLMWNMSIITVSEYHIFNQLIAKLQISRFAARFQQSVITVGKVHDWSDITIGKVLTHTEND